MVCACKAVLNSDKKIYIIFAPFVIKMSDPLTTLGGKYFWKIPLTTDKNSYCNKLEHKIKIVNYWARNIRNSRKVTFNEWGS